MVANSQTSEKNELGKNLLMPVCSKKWLGMGRTHPSLCKLTKNFQMASICLWSKLWEINQNKMST